MRNPAVPSLLPHGPVATNRRRRSLLLHVLRHGLLAAAAAGAACALGGLLLCQSPALAEWATAWLVARFTAQPMAILARMEESVKAGDHPATLRAADEFLASIPLPHPSDALGDKYRTALHAFMTATEASGRPPEWLRAGELALTFDPNDSVLLFGYGRGLAAAGQRDKAVEILESAFRIRPTSSQILHSLERLLAGTNPVRAAETRQRYYEALALCAILPSWMSGNLVAYNDQQNKVLDLNLSVLQATEVSWEVDFAPTGMYLVLPRLPELELRIREAFLKAPDGEILALKPAPQEHLTPLPDGFVRITPSDTMSLDQPTVIGLSLPKNIPAHAKLTMGIECRPSPAVADVMRVFGSWQHPGVKAVMTD